MTAGSAPLAQMLDTVLRAARTQEPEKK